MPSEVDSASKQRAPWQPQHSEANKAGPSKDADIHRRPEQRLISLFDEEEEV